MPTNLPPEAKNKWEEVEAAKNPHEKLRLLQEFLSLIPRHHGTTKLEAQTKKRITLLRKEIEEKKRKKAGRTGPKMFIQKEGCSPDRINRADEVRKEQPSCGRDECEG